MTSKWEGEQPAPKKVRVKKSGKRAVPRRKTDVWARMETPKDGWNIQRW